MISLKCPSCGGKLEIPENLLVAHCIYCGAEILIKEDEGLKNKINLNKYIELTKAAIEAENHEEVIEYCNKILEIDTKNIKAWVDKATSTFWLTSTS